MGAGHPGPQVLDNPIANALEVSPGGGRIWLRVTSSEAEVEAHVADEGPGMDPDRRARAFDRFSGIGQGDTGRRGFGLGLAVASRLVTADGGRIDLLEAPTGGLDARIRLPPGAPGRLSEPAARRGTAST